jgi:cell wall-associated NlpC family hydrolase
VRRRVWFGIGAVVAAPFVVIGVVIALVAAYASSSGTVMTVTTLATGSVPTAYTSLIEQAATMCPTLSAPLLAAQLYQESGFDPNSVSSTGAQGIAQFEPYTWPSWTSKSDGDGLENPFNPADAIPAAARYDCALAQKVAGLGGDTVNLMLAAYNAGLGAVLSVRGIPQNGQTPGYVSNIRALQTSFTATTGVIQASSVALKAIAFAYAKLGTPYLWGGTGTTADNGQFDCSGLTQAAYASVGVTLPRVANEQWFAGNHIAKGQLQIGDLVFFATDLTNPVSIHHVGLYVGNGWMIDAPHTGAFVRYDTINQPDYYGATRVTSNVPTSYYTIPGVTGG